MPIAAIDSSSQRVLSTILIHFDLEENRLAKLRYQGDSACGSLSFTFSGSFALKKGSKKF